jgi:hypothetical protein
MRFIILLCAILGNIWADSPAIPQDYVSTSMNGEFIIVIFSDETKPNWSNVDSVLRKKYKTAGIYKKDGTVVSIIDQHMWGAIVTNNGIGFGLGQWALSGDFGEIGYYICKDNKCIGVKVSDYIDHPDRLPKSVSHYKSIYELHYNTEKETVVFITYESKALVYSAVDGSQVDIKKRN